MSIGAAFNKDAAEYDSTRRLLIPCYDDFYNTAVNIIPYHKERELRILDLGAGTGILSEKLAGKYTRAQLTLIDISANMLEQAERRLLPKFQGRISCTLMDYAVSPLTGTYDLVVSALSIHHLDDDAKSQLFRKIYRHLESGGLFINCDQVLGENEYAEKFYQRTWLQQVRENGMEEHLLQAVLERMKEDKLASLTSQLHWLEKTGFVDITTWYKNYSFVVYSGARKQFQ